MWWFSAEQVVMRRTKHLMDVMTISDGTGRAMRQAKVFSMNAMLAPEVSLTIPDIADANGTFDKQEMEAAFSWICQNAKESAFQVTDFREIVISGEKAKVHFTVEGFMEQGGRRVADGSFDVTIHWVKADDGWRYDAVTWKNL
jgi:hydroxymethylpyrimidine/phosphomethylpyrimidine kinase